MKSNFQERRDARIDRFGELAEQAEQHSQDLWETGHKMADVIPFGQPILIGHHSEKRDRNYRKRIEGKFEKADKEHQKAGYYAQRAQAAASNTAIFSDDPEAVQKLKMKIAQAEQMQNAMKQTNRIIKAKKTTSDQKRAALAALGYSAAAIDALLTPDFCGRIGFPDYKLTNNNANIRRMKQRLAQLQKTATEETSEEEINGVTIRDSVEDNRVQIFFPGIPSEEIRAFLKGNGFHWSRDVGAWMRHRSNGAMYWAKEAAKQYNL